MRIPFRLPSLNEYLNKCNRNRFAGARFKKKWEDDSSYFLNGKYEGKLIVSFTFYEPNKKRDIDNVKGCAHKFLLDAMQRKGVIRNDKDVVKIIDEFVYGQGAGVEIQITEVEDAE